MAMWYKTKMPGDYIAVFHTPFLEGPGRFAIWTSYLEADVRREGNRFNAFKASLRRNPHHATAKIAAKMLARVEFRQGEDGLWEALVTTRMKDNFTELLAQKIFGEDMQNAIDTLRRHP